MPVQDIDESGHSKANSCFVLLVLTRVEMTLIDTVIRLEHVPHNCKSGIALELHIER